MVILVLTASCEAGGQRKVKFGEAKSLSSARIIISIKWKGIKFVNMAHPPHCFRLLKKLLSSGCACQITLFNSQM